MYKRQCEGGLDAFRRINCYTFVALRGIGQRSQPWFNKCVMWSQLINDHRRQRAKAIERLVRSVRQAVRASRITRAQGRIERLGGKLYHSAPYRGKELYPYHRPPL